MGTISVPDRRIFRLGESVILYKTLVDLDTDEVFDTPNRGVFTAGVASGDYIDMSDFESLLISVLSDQDSASNGLKVYGSNDGLNDAAVVLQASITADTPYAPAAVTTSWPFMRFEYTNGAVATTSLSIAVTGVPRASVASLGGTVVEEIAELTHVRKTLVLDGTAGFGAENDVLTALAITGRVKLERASIWGEALSGSGALMRFGTASNDDAYLADTTDLDGTTGYMVGGGAPAANAQDFIVPYTQDISEDLIITITGGDLSGTVIVDVWYRKITDNGLLEGD